MTQRQTLYFSQPGQVEIRTEDLPALPDDQVRVQAIVSAISPGSEMLVYRGQCPQDLPDAHDPLSSNITYPIAYGYASVGQVVEVGKSVPRELLGKLVFGFQPHTSHWQAAPENLHPVPDGLSPLTACFLPNMETAVNLVHDTSPLLGERALVLGQGIVGLLVTALLTEFPLEKLVTTELHPLRQAASEHLGAVCVNVSQGNADEAVRQALGSPADFCIEISGSPAALDTAIRQTGFGGRIIIGSWYGEKKAGLDLGGAFHRSRIQLISSQVSSINPALSARWDKLRRFEAAWQALRRIKPEQWVTQTFPLGQAAQAYQLLDEQPGQTIQVMFDYETT